MTQSRFNASNLIYIGFGGVDLPTQPKQSIKRDFMTKRERIEDLGRICEMANKLYEDEIFSLIPSQVRCKDAIDWFDGLDEDKRDDFINSVAYGLSSLQEQLAHIHCLARWGDESEEL